MANERISSQNNGIEPVISVKNVGKMYKLFDKPIDRLKHTLFWRLGKQYGRDFWALQNVSFDIYPGEIVGIVGRNGSGKSTLLQIIANILQPSVGEVSVKGRVSALLELGSGFNPEYTGRENVFMSGAIMGIDEKEMQERYNDIVAFADIGDFIDQPIKYYSSGMLARLAFSTAMSVDPDILIADEILAVGDMAFQEKCFRVFHDLRNKGVTILFVSHDVYTVRSFCQKAIYLKDGHQVAAGDSYAVIERYLTDMEHDKAVNQQAQDQSTPSLLFRFDEISLINEAGEAINEVQCGDTITLRFRYSVLDKINQKVSFVVNLYKADGLYVCGTTTIMDSIEAVDPGHCGTVEVTFPNIQLLSGNYVWRVAIDDQFGFGVLTAATNVCPFKVTDHLESVGLVHLPRKWNIAIDK